MNDTSFDDIRPYYDREINAAMCRIANNPLIQYIADFIYPDVDLETVKEMFRKIHSAYEFQTQIMHFAIQKIIDKTTSGLTCNGIYQLDKSKSYLFISNHRDILLDAAIHEMLLNNYGYKTSEITFGSNLMNPEFVVDIGKSNKMFRVERGGASRDFYKNSSHLSDYIRFTITRKDESIWIAQRNGRTKDGNDMTDQGILKMFSMSGTTDLVENFAELAITPLSISYQYEPCIIQKVKEISISKHKKYVKAPGEDLQSILLGITQFKGKVHLSVTKPIEKSDLLPLAKLPKTDIYTSILKMIDERIQSNYKLFDTNYMGYDVLNSTQDYLNINYSKEDLNSFVSTMHKELALLDGNINELQQIYLGIYANPVINEKKYRKNLLL